jgi:hypothetical protein
MIGERLIALREQRATLIVHASQQRATLDAGLTRLDSLAPWLAYLNKGARYVKARPWWLLGAVALVVFLDDARIHTLASVASRSTTDFALARVHGQQHLIVGYSARA